MFKVGLLFGFVFLSGCASTLGGQTAKPWDLLSEQAAQCFYGLEKDAELATIANKVMLIHSLEYAKETNQEFTKIRELPNPEELKVIQKWAAKLEVCYKIRAAHHAYESPRVVMASIESDAEQQLLVTELYKGKLSFGQFAIKRNQLNSLRSSLFLHAVTADIKEFEASQLYRPDGSKTAPPPSSNSPCGYVGSKGNYRWVCREKND